MGSQWFDDDVQRGWLLSVIEEYERIRDAAPGLNSLRAPGFCIDPELNRTLGKWDSRDRRIVLSAQLLDHRHWDDVVTVLKHEMAHQVVHELYGRGNEQPHGPAFRKACGLLGVAHDATIALRTGATTAGRGTTEKIRKLLALGQSPNRHEAERALAKAHELCLKYNIEQVNGAGPRRFSFRKVGPLFKRIPSFYWAIANIVQDYYFVQYICRCHFGEHDEFALGPMRQLEIYGTPDNLEMAEYAFYFLLHQGEIEWRRYKQANGSRRVGRQRLSFLNGIYDGFRSKLSRQRHTLANDKALVWMGDAELDYYFNERNPKVNNRRLYSRFDDAVHADGVAVGSRLRLRKGVKTGSRNGLHPIGLLR